MRTREERWAEALEYGELLFAAFGAPEAIAAAPLTRRIRDLMRDWLRFAEWLVRRLLFMDAAAAAPTLAPLRTRTSVRARTTVSARAPYAAFPLLPRPAGAARRVRSKGRGAAFAPDDRCDFLNAPAPAPAQFYYAPVTACAGAGAGNTAPHDPRSGRGLALRFAALLRVLAAPAPLTLRLARRLARRDLRAQRRIFEPPPAPRTFHADDRIAEIEEESNWARAALRANTS